MVAQATEWWDTDRVSISDGVYSPGRADRIRDIVYDGCIQKFPD